MMPPRLVKPPEHLKNINVMVVDNDQKITGLMAMVLKYLGFRNVFEAVDGYQAVEAMRQQEIDLIITDWDLQALARDRMAGLPVNSLVRSERWLPVPPENGAGFVKYLRASKYSPQPYLPIIMLTGIGLQDSIEYARDAGVNEILLKPLCVETLCQRIAMVVDSPRPFIIADTYKGPCRRREARPITGQERRKHDVKIVKHSAA